jgi:hypothetical protein
MVLMPVLCPHCHSDQVIKGGKTLTLYATHDQEIMPHRHGLCRSDP